MHGRALIKKSENLLWHTVIDIFRTMQQSSSSKVTFVAKLSLNSANPCHMHIRQSQIPRLNASSPLFLFRVSFLPDLSRIPGGHLPSTHIIYSIRNTLSRSGWLILQTSKVMMECVLWISMVLVAWRHRREAELVWNIKTMR
jgi:hypothetical protein